MEFALEFNENNEGILILDLSVYNNYFAGIRTSSNCDNDITFNLCTNISNCKSEVAIYFVVNNLEAFLGVLKNYQNVLYNKDIDILKNSITVVSTLKFKLLEIEKICEIYGVCVDEKQRSGGYGSKLLKFFIDTFYKYADHSYKLWLRIMFNNPYWSQAVNLYTKFGFKIDKVDFILINNIPQYYLSYFREYLSPTSNTQIAITREMSSSAKKLYDFLGKKDIKYITETFLLYNNLVNLALDLDIEFCKKEAILPPQTSKKLQGYVYEKCEYGYFFDIDNNNKMTIERAYQSDNCFQAPAFEGEIYFHSHPSSCYEEYECYIGWPSGRDVSNITKVYDNKFLNQLSLVVSLEGIWTLELTPMMKYLMLFLNRHKFYNLDVASAMTKKIEDVFNQLENARTNYFDDYINAPTRNKKNILSKRYNKKILDPKIASKVCEGNSKDCFLNMCNKTITLRLLLANAIGIEKADLLIQLLDNIHRCKILKFPLIENVNSIGDIYPIKSTFGEWKYLEQDAILGYYSMYGCKVNVA